MIATLELRTTEGPLTNGGAALEDLFVKDDDVVGVVRDGLGESFELVGRWRVVEYRRLMGGPPHWDSYRLERLR